MKKTQIQKAASALSKLGNAAKWAKNDTLEKRRACTAAATEARALRAKLKKEKWVTYAHCSDRHGVRYTQRAGDKLPDWATDIREGDK